jgi:hypothetical protein
MPDNTGSHPTKFNPSGSDSSKDAAISTQVIEPYREPNLSAELEPEFALASSEELLVMQRLLAREILGFLAFLLLSMAAILFTLESHG